MKDRPLTYARAALATASTLARKICVRVALLLALIAFAYSAAGADITVHVDSSRSSDGTDVTYTTGGGLQASQAGAGGYSFAPDTLPGHLAYSLSAGVSGTSIVALASADLARGIVRSGSNGGGTSGNVLESGGGNARFADSMTINNSSGQPATVTFVWTVEGSVTSTGSPGHFSRASYNTNFVLDGPGLGWNFNGGATVQDGSPVSASATTSGWETSSVDPFSGGYGGAMYTGTLTIPPAGRFVSISGLIGTGAGGDVPAGANFGNTAKFQLVVPQGVSFTSESGVLLSGITAVSRMTHGTAGTFDVSLPLTGTPGVECRRGPTPGAYQIIVQFANPLSSIGTTSVTSGAGQVQSASASASDVTVNVTGLTNAQTTVVTLHDVHNGAINGDVSVPISVVLGDVSGDGSVNSGDATIVRNRSGHPVDATTFRADMNADGFVDSGDATIVRNASGSGLPQADGAQTTKRGSLAASPSELIRQ